ncbi:glycoside hydrolase family 25 protein [Streptomyces fulvorobeus]|uniref:GH25 family lysozyme M1 (1,4-beta-N-acetylmuramidase) n=1 Tax=Streptomyces fulvorobeus TaxID=284028 RepID=A0A7J0CH17_9ACTN|nr:glycoside hydrolase family 25 protein [Streptomyces fulvorobeus]NYE44464.1 GH25 family lysozyme M1 (1,4-beta-N-acetylmuramidase) [Streptomyces fulvorobeus]GFN00997.1 hydrolase [Streptomyces fulvorobeus]
MLHGVDVSAYQTSFETDGLDFVFIKATEGRSYVNPRLASQTEQARDADCVVGFYHFLWPGDADEQAEYFVRKSPEQAGDVLAVDWEQTGEGTRADCADKDRFIRALKRLRPGRRVLLYCNRHFWLNHDTTSNAGDGLWIADYGTAGKPRIEAAWRIHQYTDHPLDKDVADFPSRQAMREWAGGQEAPRPAPMR